MVSEDPGSDGSDEDCNSVQGNVFVDDNCFCFRLVIVHCGASFGGWRIDGIPVRLLSLGLLFDFCLREEW